MRVRGRGRGTRRQVGWYCDHEDENPWHPYDPEGWRKNTHVSKGGWKRGKQILIRATKGMQTRKAFYYSDREVVCPKAVPVYVIDYPESPNHNGTTVSEIRDGNGQTPSV